MGQHRQLTEEERRAMAFVETMRTTHLEDPPVVCPAAAKVGSLLCLCRVEKSLIPAREQPGTFYGRCTSSNYVGCPTWQHENAHRNKVGAL